MFRLNKKILFLFFASSLFAIGGIIYLFIENGIGYNKDTLYRGLTFISLIISSVILYLNIYKKELLEKK